MTLRPLTLALGLGLALIALPGLADTTKTDSSKPAATAAAPATTDQGVSMGVPDGLPDAAHAEVGKMYLAATFEGWQQRCVKKADNSDPCQLYQLLKDDTGNPVSEISFFTLPPGGQAVMGASILVPLETLLTQNLRFSVDGAQGKVYPFSYCTVNGCLAKVGFTADEVKAMQAGTSAVITIIPAAAPDKTVNATVPLKGFAAAVAAVTPKK